MVKLSSFFWLDARGAVIEAFHFLRTEPMEGNNRVSVLIKVLSPFAVSFSRMEYLLKGSLSQSLRHAGVQESLLQIRRVLYGDTP